MSMIAALLFFAVPYGVCIQPPTDMRDMTRKHQKRWINYYLNRHPVTDTDQSRFKCQPRRDVGGTPCKEKQ